MSIKSLDELSPSKRLSAYLCHTFFQILKDNNGQMPIKELIKSVESTATLDDWAKEKYEKTGYIRWESTLYFRSITAVKSGFLVKKKGVWFLTPEGEEALKGGELSLHNAVIDGYRKWKGSKNNITDVESDSSDLEDAVITEFTIEQVQRQARDGLTQHISKLNPYEFQDLCASLLRGMNYHTPFVAPRGKDGGVDIIAYKDPLGTESPRIKIQVKHRTSPANVSEVRQLMGLIQNQGEAGIFISSGGFTSDCTSTVRNASVHVELIDLDRFIDMWQEFYVNITDQDKNYLPMTSIFFLKPSS